MNTNTHEKDYCEACHYELLPNENQYCADCAESLENYIMQQHKRWQQERAERFRDYEPEQAYGTHHDFSEHLQYGGTREDY